MLNRRQFFQIAATASALALPIKATEASDRSIIKPLRLKPGAVVGIISPASANNAYCNLAA